MDAPIYAPRPRPDISGDAEVFLVPLAGGDRVLAQQVDVSEVVMMGAVAGAGDAEEERGTVSEEVVPWPSTPDCFSPPWLWLCDVG